ncbi:methyltransferase domain-containing protein [Nocardiopsis sp. CNT-189]|uniref:methyltransferase domain-containing protein n=1 Tax=Nocardiopsis oceanisediminis TaxID=2816862 RepID=UPI003B2B6A6B
MTEPEESSAEALAEREWRLLARELADPLPAGASVRSAFARVPRHVFVPSFYECDGEDHREVASGDPRWPEAVYADETLTVQIGETPLGPRPASSSTRPSLMAAMLEALDPAPGMRVLEIGTGTGYNAAVLAALLGDEHVVTLDIDPRLSRAARERLAEAGYRPTVVTGDGAAGCAEHAPYDRVIATHAVERVPCAWVAQTRPGGVILADVRSVGAPGIGHLARLTVRGDGTADGGFDVSAPGVFMPDRNGTGLPHFTGRTGFDLRDASPRRTDLGSGALEDPGFAFALWNALPDMTLLPGPQSLLSTPDGSWAIIGAPSDEVRVAGPRDLWAVAESTHSDWRRAGRPGIAEYRIRVTPHGQRITMPL